MRLQGQELTIRLEQRIYRSSETRRLQRRNFCTVSRDGEYKYSNIDNGTKIDDAKIGAYMVGKRTIQGELQDAGSILIYGRGYSIFYNIEDFTKDDADLEFKLPAGFNEQEYETELIMEFLIPNDLVDETYSQHAFRTWERTNINKGGYKVPGKPVKQKARLRAMCKLFENYRPDFKS